MRLEHGKVLSNPEPFDLPVAIREATNIYQHEAIRRNLEFVVDVSELESGSRMAVGVVRSIKAVIERLAANACMISHCRSRPTLDVFSVKYTESGRIDVTCRSYYDLEHTRNCFEVIVSDTGCGIAPPVLQAMFKHIEELETRDDASPFDTTTGLG